MSPKTLKMLLGVLAVLVVAWGSVAVVSSSRRAGQGPADSPTLAGFFGAREANVAEVRLAGPLDTVRLERQGGTWSANGYRADSGAVARFWTALEEGRVGEVVATNPSNHRRMGVASDSTWRVELDVGGTFRSILVGKTGPKAATTFVRFPAADTVYLVQGDLRIRVAYTTDDWRDRRILAVDTSAVARIGIELDGQRYTILRSHGTWTLAGGGKTDTMTVRIILTELAYLHAAGFLERGDTIARKPYGGAVLALTAAGDTLARLTLGSGGGDRWARTRGDSTLYRLAYYRVERVAPTRKQVTGGK